MPAETISFSHFRQNATQYLYKVEHGNKIIITRHGQSIAEINPIQKKKTMTWKKPPAFSIELPGVSITKEIIKERKRSRA